MMKTHEVKQQAERDLNFLIDHLSEAALFHSNMLKLKYNCQKITQGQRAFRNHASAVHRIVRDAFKTDFALKVTVLNDSEVNQSLSEETGGSKFRSETIHRLEGSDFCSSTFNSEEELQAIVTFFQNNGLLDMGDHLDYVSKIESSPEHLSRLAKEFRGAVTSAEKLINRTSNALKFFSKSNLEGLKRYGQHPAGDVPFALKFDDNRTTFQVNGATSLCNINLGIAFFLPEIFLPTWD